MIEISSKKYKSLPSLKEYDYIKINHNELYKTFLFLVDSDIEFLKYLLSLPKIDGLILPNNLLCIDGKILGYSMDYLKHSITVSKYLTSFKDNKMDISNIINSLFTSLDEAHKHFVITDIHNKNTLVTKDKAYFIDLDNGIKERTIYAPVKYSIYIDGNIVEESFLTDNIKTLLVTLSLYYKLNFEKIYEKYGIEGILLKLKESNANKEFITYLEYLIDCSRNNNYYNIESFSKYISNLDKLSSRQRTKFLKTF